MAPETFLTIKVDGMACTHCEANISRNLSNLPGINEVIADKNTAQVKISGTKIDLAEIEHIITDLGYQFKGKVE